MSVGIESPRTDYILEKALSKGPKMTLWPLQVDIMITLQPLMKKNSFFPIIPGEKSPR